MPTTADITKATQAPVVDKTLVPPKAPAKPETGEPVKSVSAADVKLKPLDDAELLSDESIIARPLGGQEALDMFPKDPAIAFRWVNRKGQDGSWYEKAKSQGFTNAKAEDVQGMADSALVKADGTITIGDVILMKINRNLYQGALKYNQEKAEARVSPKNIHKAALGEAQSSLRQDTSGVPQEYLKNRVGFFTPPQDLAEKLTK